jgi:hypothetical protein
LATYSGDALYTSSEDTEPHQVNPTPTLSINDAPVTEGAGVTAGFTVSLSAAHYLTVTVNWATANGTAVAGADYTAASGTVTFTPGQVARPVNVSILDDALQETDETYFVNLSGPVNSTIADGQGLGSIRDDGDAPPAATDGFATGTGGRNWRYNEGTESWDSQSLICSCNLFGVWGTDVNDVFAVGTNASIRHYNGSSWATQFADTIITGRAVWGSSSNDVFLVGEGGTRIEHYNGSGWSRMTTGIRFGGLYGVSGSSSNNVYAVGWDGSTGLIYHYTGGAWTSISSGVDVALDGVWVSASGEVFVVGDGGTVLHYDGFNWGTMTQTATGQNLNDVWGTAPDDVYAVGESGAIIHYDGNGWTLMTTGISNHFTGIWGTSSSDIFAVGTATTFMHYDGTGWTRQSPNTGNLNIIDVWVP